MKDLAFPDSMVRRYGKGDVLVVLNNPGCHHNFDYDLGVLERLTLYRILVAASLPLADTRFVVVLPSWRLRRLVDEHTPVVVDIPTRLRVALSSLAHGESATVRMNSWNLVNRKNAT
eukprot:Plantae.Rhodophyta-Palmaria_palmata.ctg18535.p2 GENE.Plantae.Rhodophyta-Palmaria_palmata.ctg18535~~Plantae.Rhodophyta-Palmaria_palmata.ctg18535.p2  ORF type:complete len:117 (-),score=15.19 Plantae.Rhodophyta-Palmaria_palmata.ctg18535:36-386(-)